MDQNPYSGKASPIQEIKNFIGKKDVLSRLILINVVIFIIINVFGLIQYLLGLDREFIQATGVNRITYYLSLPSDLSSLIYRPWSLVTYMFVQEDVFHLFFNVLILYVGGQIFNRFIGEKKMLSTYILSGFVGALLYIITFNIFPAFREVVSASFAIGASASVLGVFIAAATYSPNLPMNVIFFGNVKLKYIAIVFIALDLLNIRTGNAGGHIAHLGGAFYGYIFISQLKKGMDFSTYFNHQVQKLKSLFFHEKKKNSPFQKVYKSDKRPLTDDEYLTSKKKHQHEIDAILDKIKKSGYDSLSTTEKQKLFQESKK
ncbi:MAG: rhomboid family intramembrane serine protease [Bacteroidales bacterium]|nr:rhomboid family intramembrane serine protease [Bacteroidales bacterium]